MLPLTKDALLELTINLMFYFTIGSFGAFLKDLYETMTKKNEKIRFGEILIGGACATFICFGLQDSWLKGLSLNMMVLITFICGILGFELFGNFTTMNKFEKFVAKVMEIKGRFNVEYTPPPPPPNGVEDDEDSTKKNNDTVKDDVDEKKE